MSESAVAQQPEPHELSAEEAAAERRRQRRNHQTAFNLVIATIASLGVMLFLVLVVVRPDPAPREPIDYAAVAAEAQPAFAAELVVPVLPPGWDANAARVETLAGVPGWYLGLLTPGGQFIAVNQAPDADRAWVQQVLAGANTADSIRIDGIDWAIADRREVRDPGNHAYAMVAETTEGTIVLHGTAETAEFELLATAIAAELR